MEDCLYIKKKKLQGVKKKIYLVNERKPKQNTDFLTKPGKYKSEDKRRTVNNPFFSPISLKFFRLITPEISFGDWRHFNFSVQLNFIWSHLK